MDADVDINPFYDEAGDIVRPWARSPDDFYELQAAVAYFVASKVKDALAEANK